MAVLSQVARRTLTGWGRTNATNADVVAVANHEVAAALGAAGGRGVLVRGPGRSYGDSAQNSGGLVLQLEGSAHEAVLDEAAGTITVPAGVSLGDLLRRIVPRGWFVPVTPGTRFVTMGGAIASDVHGKGHHLTGSFGNHVRSLRLLLADGTVADVAPHRRADLFWATIGGMGLTGVILDVTFALLPIETSRMTVDTTRLPDLDAVFAAMEEGDADYRYSVAWIDPVGRGRHLGRSVLGRGDHATLAQLSPRELRDPLAYGPKVLATLPPLQLPVGLINRTTINAFNEVWFRKAPRHREGEVQTIATFWHPLDMVGGWNRLYGAKGMVQYQFVVPFGQEGAIRAVLERLTEGGASSFLSVLKRFGPGNPAPLSFPREGWTLAVDLPVAIHGIAELLHGLDRIVLDAGGRHYLTKDGHTTPAAIAQGYPRLEEWKAVRRTVDPQGMWQSDQSRRLGLTD